MSTFSAVNQIHDIYASIIKITFNKICPFVTCAFSHNFLVVQVFFSYILLLRLRLRAIAYGLLLVLVFSISRVRDFGIIISISDFENSSIWWIDAVQIDLRINISISIRSMIPRFDRQVHLEELTQMRLIKEVLVTSSHHDHVILERCFIFFSAMAMVFKFCLNNYEEA